MKKSRYTEEQIAFVLKQAELGISVEEICRKIGITEQTFYRWKTKYGGMLPSDMKRLKQLEQENAQLKKLVADLSLDKAMLQNAVLVACYGSIVQNTDISQSRMIRLSGRLENQS